MLLLAAGVYDKANAQQVEIAVSKKSGWHKIGQAIAKNRRDFVIGENKYTGLKFTVKETPIKLTSLEMYFDNGSTQKVEPNYKIAVNGETQIMLFDDGERRLKKVKLAIP